MKDSFREAFIEEAVELLNELEYCLLELENDSNANDSDLIAKVFRALHTFKGSSGMFGFDEISLFIHDIETVYEHIRRGEIKITQEIIGLTLSAKDRIGEMLNGHNTISSANDQKTKDILLAFRNIIRDYGSKNADQSSENESGKLVENNDTRENDSTYHIHFQPHLNFFLNGTNPVYLLNELKILGPSKIIGHTDAIPCLEYIDPSKCYSYWDIILTTAKEIDDINEVFVFVDQDMNTLNIKLLDDCGKLNNKSAHNLLEQLLIHKSDISREDVDEIIEKLKHLNRDNFIEKFSDYQRLEKLKENFRNSGLTVLVDEIKNIIACIYEFILKLEGDSKNQDYLTNISGLLRTIVDISDYICEKELSQNAHSLEKLIICFIDKPVNFDSETVEVFIRGIDHLNEILENVLSGIPVEDKKDLISLIDKLIAELSIFKIENPAELDITPDKVDETILKEFLISTNVMLESLEQNVLKYEKSDSKENLNEIFRIVHTIKGDSMMARLDKLVSYAGILENLLHNLRNGQIKRTEVIIDIILKASGTIADVIKGLNYGNYNILKNHDIQILKDLILVFENRVETKPIKIIETVSNSNPKTTAFLNQVIQYKEMILISIEDSPLNDEKLKVLERLLNNLENAAKYMKHIELLRKVQKSKGTLRNGQQDVTQKSIYSLVEFLSNLINGEIPIEVAESGSMVSIKAAPYNGDQKIQPAKRMNEEETNLVNEKPKAAVEVENKTMRVDEFKIDSFSNMIGELVIARNSYEYLLSEVLSNNNIEPTTEKKLNDNLHLLSRLTNDLQSGVITLRMIPLKSIFQKYTRVIRDISKKQNKKIDFVTLGNETEVDKKIADSLSDPLIHLIRNSCDHGIELPEDRVKLGKPEIGTISLKASIEGGDLIIVIKDDGQGLNRKKIYKKAKEMGLDTQNYDDNTILDLILEPGFSTKSEVSELSGRGVGMDVVKTTIDKLGGSINIRTEENIGTEITFVIPMSIGLSDSLLVEANGETYALPIQSVLKTLKLEPTQFFRLHDRLGFQHRGEIIPTATLFELLNGKSEELDTKLNTFKEKIYNNDIDEIPVVIIQTKKGNYGILVEKLMKNIELSIKPFPERIGKSNIISGVSILGNGNVVLVLNPEKLV